MIDQERGSQSQEDVFRLPHGKMRIDEAFFIHSLSLSLSSLLFSLSLSASLFLTQKSPRSHNSIKEPHTYFMPLDEKAQDSLYVGLDCGNAG